MKQSVAYLAIGMQDRFRFRGDGPPVIDHLWLAGRYHAGLVQAMLDWLELCWEKPASAPRRIQKWFQDLSAHKI